MEPVPISGLTAILKFYGTAIIVTLAVAAVVLLINVCHDHLKNGWQGLFVQLYQVWQVAL